MKKKDEEEETDKAGDGRDDVDLCLYIHKGARGFKVITIKNKN